ncbi:MAG: hypothetical protein K2L83_02195 [Muribaculaceae bacterium]|nr:hypothetical protein [Muribaculaceae bacterium]
MNLTNTCPDIPDNWKGGMNDVCRILGRPGKPMSRETLRKYAELGKKFGGIDYTPGINGRRVFSGKEVKRFWKSL